MGAAVMARGRKSKSKGKPKLATEYLDPPNLSQQARSDFERAGLAYRKIAMIDTLKKTGHISQRQYDGLAHYREKANAADRSPIRSAIDFSIHGNGEGLPHFGVIINREMVFLNSALGDDLQPTAWAIAVMDKSPSEWAIELFGSVIRIRQRGPWQLHCIEPRIGGLRTVQQAIRDAGDRLAKALGV